MKTSNIFRIASGFYDSETYRRLETCLLKYRGEARYHMITRERAAYLFRAARSRRAKNTTRIALHAGGCTRRIEDASCILTTNRPA